MIVFYSSNKDNLKKILDKLEKSDNYKMLSRAFYGKNKMKDIPKDIINMIFNATMKPRD